MASVGAVRPRGRCSSTDPASLPDDLFHRVLDTVYRRGDVTQEDSTCTLSVGGTILMIARVSRTWHQASMRALTVARVRMRFEREADLLEQLTRFKSLTKIALCEDVIESLSTKFLEAACMNWPDLRTLVLRNAPTRFSGSDPASHFFPSLTSVVIRQNQDSPWRRHAPMLAFLPHWIHTLKSLTNLEILDCDIQELPASFRSSFPKLRRLRLCEVQKLSNLPESMADLVCLDELILNSCDVRALPQAFSRLSALRRLIWTHSCITDVSVIATLKGLRYLSLSTCRLEDKVPAGLFAGLKQLRVLKLSTEGSGNTSPSPALQGLIHCTGLRVLKLNGCEGLLGDLGWLPELSALRKFEVSGNDWVPDLPANIGALKHLERACFVPGHFKTLPWSFGDLRSLRYLRLESCALEELPDSLASLMQLTELVLSGIKACDMAPMKLGNMTSIQALSLIGFSFTGIPEEIGFLPNLTKLEIECEPCDSLLPRGFPSLQELSIFGRISTQEYSAFVAQLTVEDYPCLKSLCIKVWECEALPSALGHLRHLEHLELCHGMFFELPETLSSLCNLKELHLHDCTEVESVPASLGTISSLTKLCLESCDNFEPDSLTGRLNEVKRACRSKTILR